MGTPEETRRALPGTSSRRGRGERAGIDRAAILAAARTMDAAELTMQGLADILGVDRKALHHHVSGREALLELLAEDTFIARMSAVAIADDAPWEDACRMFVDEMRRALVDSGALMTHFRVSSQVTLASVRPAEVVLERMLAAGFDERDAGRGLLLLTTIGVGFAREQLAASGDAGHPHVRNFRDMLAGTDAADLGVLRRLDDSDFDAYGDEQFRFDVDAFLTAMSARLPRP
jgi:AcrR family transcriptional regulator